MVYSQSNNALNTLDGPDGSATYSSNGYTVIAAVNGPIEVSRRDEQPEESTLEVNVRPASGVGAPRDRHLELLLHSTLSRIVSTETFPRSLIQLTLQILKIPISNESLPRSIAQSTLLSLPALLNASLLALISGAVPLCVTITTFLAFTVRGQQEPLLVHVHKGEWGFGTKDITAIHVLAITGDGQIALSESEGDFSFEEWEAVSRAAKIRAQGHEGDMEVDGEASSGRQWLLNLTRGTTEDIA